MFTGCGFEKTNHTAILFSISERTYREALTWQVLSIAATTSLVGEDFVKVYVERTKPLAQYTTEELYAWFRFGNADIKYIAELVRPKLQRRTRRSHALSVEEHVFMVLRFYVSGTFYQIVGDNIGVDKSTVSDAVKAVSIALASLVSQFVSFPKDDQIAQTKHKFFSFRKHAQYYWGYWLHSCAYTNSSWEGVGVHQSNGEAQHQHPTSGWRWPHHHKLRREVAWVCPWCTHPEVRCSIQRAPNQPTRWHNIRRQYLSTPTMADHPFSCSKHTCAGTLQHTSLQNKMCKWAL